MWYKCTIGWRDSIMVQGWPHCPWTFKMWELCHPMGGDQLQQCGFSVLHSPVQIQLHWLQTFKVCVPWPPMGMGRPHWYGVSAIWNLVGSQPHCPWNLRVPYTTTLHSLVQRPPYCLWTFKVCLLQTPHGHGPTTLEWFFCTLQPCCRANQVVVTCILKCCSQ